MDAMDAVDAVEQHRQDYTLGSLDVGDVHADPLRQLERWIADAVAAEVGEPNAMTVATVDADGLPDARVVLLRRITERELVWFTDRRSAKGTQLRTTQHAALVFHWQPLERQVRVRGGVAALDDAASDAYFASRPRGSRLSAWASHQSQPTPSRRGSTASRTSHVRPTGAATR
jgi:pyridoxamine 5'-phosphate oxidase